MALKHCWTSGSTFIFHSKWHWARYWMTQFRYLQIREVKIHTPNLNDSDTRRTYAFIRNLSVQESGHDSVWFVSATERIVSGIRLIYRTEMILSVINRNVSAICPVYMERTRNGHDLVRIASLTHTIQSVFSLYCVRNGHNSVGLYPVYRANGDLVRIDRIRHYSAILSP